MNAEQFEGIYMRLHAAYPHDFRVDDLPVRGLWESMFCHHDANTVRAAVTAWMMDHRRAPAISDLVEGIKLQRRTVEGPKRTGSFCGSCDRGWVWVDQTGTGVVESCRNGCVPPLPDNGYLPPDGPADDRAANIARVRDVLAGLNPPRRGQYA